jgi:hypothetical protein
MDESSEELRKVKDAEIRSRTNYILSLTTEDSESSTSLRPIPKQQQQLYHPQRDKKEACKSQGEKECTRGPNNGYTSGKFLACLSAFLAFALLKGASPEN